MKKASVFLSVMLLVSLLTGCAAAPQKQTATFFTLFDTVTTVVQWTENKTEFEKTAQVVYDELLSCHQLFDIYNDYEGLNNLKTVNDNAGIAAVEVDRKIIDLLLDCKAYHELTGGVVNVAMGSVLELWHTARNDGIEDPANAYLPERAALEEAALHTDLSSVMIDEAASTVYITDAETSLDVGAIAKGWALQRVCERLPEGLLISVGGNVCATGPKQESGTSWLVGVQDPDSGDKYLHTLSLSQGSVVTSGDYQRAYVVDGKLYHHIIDPATLHPAALWRSVTIVCADSGLADALSTALFLLPREEGQKLLDQCGAMAMWVDGNGSIFYSPGLEAMIQS